MERLNYDYINDHNLSPYARVSKQMLQPNKTKPPMKGYNEQATAIGSLRGNVTRARDDAQTSPNAQNSVYKPASRLPIKQKLNKDS